MCPALQPLNGPQTPARTFSVKRLRRSSPAGGVISWMNMNDCRCVRGHAADFIEHFCDGGASSRHVARQQVVHNEKVSVGRKAPRCRQSCQLTHAGRLTSSVESYLGHLVHRIIQPECAPRPTLTQGRAEPDRLLFSKYLWYRRLGDLSLIHI